MPNCNCGENSLPINGKPGPTRDNSFRVRRIRETIKRVSMCNYRSSNGSQSIAPKQEFQCKNHGDQHVNFVIWRRFTKNARVQTRVPNTATQVGALNPPTFAFSCPNPPALWAHGAGGNRKIFL